MARVRGLSSALVWTEDLTLISSDQDPDAYAELSGRFTLEELISLTASVSTFNV